MVLQDLPDNVLAKVLDSTGNNARTLCEVVDALSRTDRRGRDMTAWEEIASLYSMPGGPTQQTVYHWRRFVMAWCEKIKPGVDANGVAYLKLSLDAALWATDFASWQWIITTAGLGNVPLSWVQSFLSLIVSLGRDPRYMALVWAKQRDLPHNIMGKTQLMHRALEIGNVQVGVWILNKLRAEADVATWPPGRFDDEEIVEERQALHNQIVYSAYQAVDADNYAALVPVLEAIVMPHRRHMGMMLKSAIDTTGTQDEAITMMRWLDARYTYRPEELQQLITSILNTTGAVPSDGQPYGRIYALLQGWEAR